MQLAQLGFGTTNWGGFGRTLVFIPTFGFKMQGVGFT
jgi:hypothetical protein